jgi:hypothetical protein
MLNRRHFVLGTGPLALLGSCASQPAGPAHGIAGLRLLGAAALPTGILFAGVEFGGISGLDRDADGSFWALSDDGGGQGRPPRLYQLDIRYDGPGPVKVSILGQVLLRRPDGSPFPADQRTVDPEALRAGGAGRLLWASEGVWHPDPARRFQPFVREMRTDGGFVRELPLPAAYAYVDNTSAGSRDNKSLEALALAPDGTVFIANEDALAQDGTVASLQAGSVVRVTALDPATGAAAGQWAYELPRIPRAGVLGARGAPDNGLVELLAAGPRSFIAVERAYAPGVGNTIRLVLTEITGATTDIGALGRTDGAIVPMTRELLLEMPPVWNGLSLDNIEAVCWGHRLANGHRTLVLAADNNFQAGQRSLFIVLEVLPG